PAVGQRRGDASLGKASLDPGVTAVAEPSRLPLRAAVAASLPPYSARSITSGLAVIASSPVGGSPSLRGGSAVASTRSPGRDASSASTAATPARSYRHPAAPPTRRAAAPAPGTSPIVTPGSSIRCTRR